MSKYSAVVEGKWGDFGYRLIHTGDVHYYEFSVGDVKIGQLHRMHTKDWGAFLYELNDLGVVNGFKSRHKASEFLIQAHNGIKDNKAFNEVLKINEILRDELNKLKENR